MSIFGSIATNALGIGSNIFACISSAQAMREIKRKIEQEKADNQQWRDRYSNIDASQRSAAQRMLSITQQHIADLNRLAAGRQAVMGATGESVAAEKTAHASVMANASSQIAAAAENQRLRIESQYKQRRRQLEGSLRAISSSNIVRRGLQTAASLFATIDKISSAKASSPAYQELSSEEKTAEIDNIISMLPKHERDWFYMKKQSGFDTVEPITLTARQKRDRLMRIAKKYPDISSALRSMEDSFD